MTAVEKLTVGAALGGSHVPDCVLRCEKVESRPWPEDVKAWYRRASHERFCLNVSSGVFGVVCPRCLRVYEGSPAGTGGADVCWCEPWTVVRPSEVVKHHGLELVFPDDKVESATGRVVGA